MTNDTIAALSTPAGVSALSVVRLSGPESLEIIDTVFRSAGKTGKLKDRPGNTAHFGIITDEGDAVDEVVVTVFRAPNSYTGEDTVEISCHGSVFIQQEILQLLIRRGARMAGPGEFTQRAFLNGKMDLSQAEAVADLIESESRASHATAINQMRGGYSRAINGLREQLIDFASMIELELDFSEEDVEFADREKFAGLIAEIKKVVAGLADSYSVGNVIKNGVPVVIAGAPNVGKSTLLNALLNEERAIVSHIAGTTRDTVEDEITIEGIKFRFIDTAGIRRTDDFIERKGIERTFEKISQAAVILYLIDPANDADGEGIAGAIEMAGQVSDGDFILVVNKSDLLEKQPLPEIITENFSKPIKISARSGEGIDRLKNELISRIPLSDVRQTNIVTNVRHYEALRAALAEILKIETGLREGISGDLLAIDVRRAIRELSSIVGEITDEAILDNIFSRFCIGK